MKKSAFLISVISLFSVYAIAQCTAVSVSSQPQNKTVTAGTIATFSVTAAGTAPFLYFWYRNGTQIAGATSSSYTTPTLTTADNGNTYYCIITNCASTKQAISNTATLTVNSSCTPVTISSQPQDKTVSSGNTATFSVTASGTAPFQYFWYKNGVQIQGASNSSYTTPALTTADNGNTYYCNLTNCNFQSGITTRTAALSVTSACTPVTISSQPQDKTANAGSTATFSVTAAGTAPIQYFWYKNGVQISGASSSSYTTPALTAADNGNTYYCNLANCNFQSGITTRTATLTINSSCTPVSVSSQPQSQSVNVGATATFTVNAAGSAPFLYFWYKNGTQIPGATSSSYTTSAMSASDNGNTYYCIITNCNSSQQAISNTATLTVTSSCLPVSVSSQPQSQSVNSGSNVTFSVTAAGTAPFLYFWYKNGTQIPGATSSSYTTPSVTVSDNGNTYYCIITNCNSSQQAISNTATLTVSGISTNYTIGTSSSPVNGGTTSGGGTYSSGTQINLNASFATGWNFVNWTENGTIVSTSASFPVTVNANRNFIANFTQPGSSGSVNVNITPIGAVNAGAQWNLDGSIYYNSGVTVSASIGTHTINFKPVPGWTTPSSKVINVTSGNTTNVSAIYTTSRPPITFWAGAYTKPESVSNLDEKFLGVYSTTNSPSTTSAKICADGSKATIIKVTCDDPGFDMRNIRFKIENDQNQSDKNLYGEFNLNNYYSTANIAQVKFTHPNYLNSSNTNRTDVIDVYDIINPSVILLRLPIIIYRAPMLFVHGLWGSYSSFQDMDNYFRSEFNNTDIVTVRADYSANNGAAKSFSDNRYTVSKWVSNTLRKAYESNFSSGKVDVICHSMGGVLARLYLQSPEYVNDIHTLTTINTPHSGTQAANLLKSSLAERMWLVLAVAKRCVTCGAVDDLKINSTPFSNNLNGNVRKVPALVYTSDSYNSLSLDAIAMDLTYFANQRFFVSYGILNPLMMVQSLYNPDISDVIVPLESQKGGVQNFTHYSKTTHINAESNQTLFPDIKNKLGQNPATLVFNQNGFNHADLKMPKWWYNSYVKPLRMTTTGDSIKITSPVRNLVYNPGDTVNFHLSRLNNITNYLGAVLMNNDQAIFYTGKVDSVLKFQYIIPADVFGKVDIVAWGINQEGNYELDSLSFFVNINASLTKLEIQPDSFYISLGEYENIHVTGTYSDGITRVMSILPGVKYTSSDSNTVSVQFPNTLFAKNKGISQVMVEYNGFKDSIVIIVTDKQNYNFASFRTTTNTTCNSGEINFYDQSGGVPISWSWEFPGGSPATSTIQNPVIRYDNPGYYNVRLITTWSDKTDTVDVQKYITVNNPPKPFISGSNSICASSVSLLDAGTGYSNYLWSTGETTPTIKDSTTGNVTVTVSDNNGCTGSASFSLVVNPIISPSVKIAPVQSLSICSGQSITLKASTTNSGSSPTFIWYMNNSVIQSGADSTFVSPGLTANTQVYCSVNSNSNCVSPSTATSNVLTINVNPLLIPTINISPDKSSVCSGQKATFTAVSVNGGSQAAYNWYINGSQVQSGTNATFVTPILNSDIQVQCIMTSSEHCITQQNVTSAVIPVTVIPIPIPSISISQSSCTGNNVSFTSSINNGGSKPLYLWTLNGTAAGNFNNADFILSNAKNGDIVQCTLTSNATCVTQSRVSSSPIKIDCVLPAVNNIDGVEGLLVVPNPNDGDFIIRIKLSKEKNVSFDLINSSGQTVLAIAPIRINGVQKIRVSKKGLSPGLYQLKTIVDNQSFVTKVQLLH